MARLGSSTALALCATLLATPSHSQQVPVTPLSQPDRVCERAFTNLVGIKELRDGRVILADEIERLILLLDTNLSNGKPVGRTGSGPREYEVPFRLLSLAGDSSAVTDKPNGRFLVLTPDGEPGGVIRFIPRVFRSKYSDGRGQLYFDYEYVIFRWSPPSPTVDSVAVYPAWSEERTEFSLNPAEYDPFLTTGRWAVAPDGRIAIVHPDPYRVEILGSDGVVTEGPAIPFDPVEVTEGHKDDWRRKMTKPVVGLLYEPKRWPEYLPAFLGDHLQFALIFAPDGRLWVQRTTPVGDPTTFDVFNQEGVRVQQVTLPQGRRLLGFGNGTVYAVVRDDFDLEYLERYSLRSGM